MFNLFKLQGTVSINTRAADVALVRLEKEADKAAAGLRNVDGAAAHTGQRVSAAGAQINNGGAALEGLRRRAAAASSGMSAFGGVLLGIGAAITAGVTAPLLALGRAAVESAVSIDRQVNVLKSLTGSAAAAEARFAKLTQVAQNTPGLTANLAATLDAQLRVASVTEQTIDRILPGIAKLNAISPLGDPQRFAQNLIQLVTQNFEKIDLKEMVGQSPLSGELIKQMFGVDSPIDGEAIRKKAQKLGLQTTDAFFDAFAKAAASNSKLADVTESIGTQFDKLTGRVMVALRPLGLAIVDSLKPMVDAAVPVIEKLSQSFAALSPGAQSAVIAIGAVAIATGPLVLLLGGATIALGGFLSALGPISLALGALTGTAAASAVAVEAVAVAAVTSEAAAVAAAAGWASFGAGVTAAGAATAVTATATTAATTATAAAAAGFSLFNPIVLGVATALGAAGLAYYAFSKSADESLQTNAAALKSLKAQTDELEAFQQATRLAAKPLEVIQSTYDKLTPLQQARVRMLGEESGATSGAVQQLNGLVAVLKEETAEREKQMKQSAFERSTELANQANLLAGNTSVLTARIKEQTEALDKAVRAKQSDINLTSEMIAGAGRGRGALAGLQTSIENVSAAIANNKIQLVQAEAEYQNIANAMVRAAIQSGTATEAFINQAIAAGQLRDKLMELGTTVPTSGGQPDKSSPNYQPFTPPVSIKPPRISGSGGSGASKALSDFQQMQERLKAINKEIAYLSNASSKEYKLAVQISGAEQARSDLQQLIELRRNLFKPEDGGQVGQFKALQEYDKLQKSGANNGLIGDAARAQIEATTEAYKSLTDQIAGSLPRTADATVAATIAQSDFFKAIQLTNPFLAEQIRLQAQAADKTIVAAKAGEAYKQLQEQLSDRLDSFKNLSEAATLSIQLQGDAYKNLTAAQRENLLALAKQIDGQIAYQKAVDDSKKKADEFKAKVERLSDSIVASFDRALGQLREKGFGAFFASLGNDILRGLQNGQMEKLRASLDGIFSGLGQKSGALGDAVRGVMGVDKGMAQAAATSQPIVSAVQSSTQQIVSAIQAAGWSVGPGAGGGGLPRIPGVSIPALQSPPTAISAAGTKMSGAITKAGEKSTVQVAKAGQANAASLQQVGAGVVGAIGSIASSMMLALAASQTGFWKGLGFAVAGGAIGALTSYATGKIEGSRAAGGPVAKGKSYIVGEKRRELFVPEQDGYIMPFVPKMQAAGAGGHVVNQHFNFSLPNVSDVPTFKRSLAQVERETARKLGNTGRRLG